jgi:hypothetical protein
MTEILIYTNTTSFANPGDWTAVNSIECIGAGGSTGWLSATQGSGGGAGGSYAVALNISPTFPVTVSIPVATLAVASNSTSFGSFCTASRGNGHNGSLNGSVNTNQSSFPAGNRGGAGGQGYTAALWGGGGGGCGGPQGAGNTGTAGTNGAGGTANAGQGRSGVRHSTLTLGNGGQGAANSVSGAGGTYGGGCGGQGSSVQTQGNGGPGVIAIVYTPVIPPAKGSTAIIG